MVMDHVNRVMLVAFGALSGKRLVFLRTSLIPNGASELAFASLMYPIVPSSHDCAKIAMKS